jgi:alkane 1-monooxygenase
LQARRGGCIIAPMNTAPASPIYASRFLLALLGTLMPVAGYLRGDNYHAFLVTFLIIPALDWLAGRDESNAAPDQAARLERSQFFRAILYLYAPLHLGLIAWGAYVVTHGGLAPAQNLGLALSIGIVTGAQGITIAHELGHKASAADRALARILLVTVSYGHFAIEHNRGHHVRVATPEDPATARYGESFWRFLPRTVIGSWLSAWEIECTRLQRLGLAPSSWRNQMLWFAALPIAIAVALGLALGPAASVLFFVQSAMAITLLETVNYVEHYGLTRNKGPDGRYERVGIRHSWDADNLVTNCFLIHLQRHADHHTHPARPYQALRHLDGSPKLPAGYAGMIPLALVPPLWFAAMNPRVEALRRAASAGSTAEV